MDRGVTCPHKWRVEAPRDARIRWEKTGEAPEYIGVCSLCGEKRGFPAKIDEDFNRKTKMPPLLDREDTR